MKHQKGSVLLSTLVLFCLIGYLLYEISQASRLEELWEEFVQANDCEVTAAAPNAPAWQVTFSHEGMGARQIEVPGRQTWQCRNEGGTFTITH